MNKIIINIDGACKGNPGPSAIGVIISDEQKGVIARISKAIGRTTNNRAEYMAVIAALEKAVAMGAERVEIRSDSELLVRQITGKYKVKNAGLLPLYEKAKQLELSISTFKIRHVPREENREADELANRALKRPTGL